jgi:hypothetical protein
VRQEAVDGIVCDPEEQLPGKALHVFLQRLLPLSPKILGESGEWRGRWFSSASRRGWPCRLCRRVGRGSARHGTHNGKDIHLERLLDQRTAQENGGVEGNED